MGHTYLNDPSSPRMVEFETFGDGSALLTTYRATGEIDHMVDLEAEEVANLRNFLNAHEHDGRQVSVKLPYGLSYRATVVKDYGNGMTRVRIADGTVTFKPGELWDVSTDRLEFD